MGRCDSGKDCVDRGVRAAHLPGLLIGIKGIRLKTLGYSFTVIVEAVRLYTRHRAHHWAATITLFSFTLLFPITLLTTFFMQSIEVEKLVAFLRFWMPEQAAQGIASILSRSQLPDITEVALGLLVIVWGLTHIIHSIIEITDEMYEYHRRHFWHRRLLAFMTLVILMVWQFITLMIHTSLSIVGRRLLSSGLFTGPPYIVHLIHWVSTLLLIILQIMSLILIYGMTGPDFRWKKYLPGAFFTAVLGWIATRLLITWARIVPIQDIYGALTNMVIFILWVYWESTVLIVGIGVNRVMEIRQGYTQIGDSAG